MQEAEQKATPIATAVMAGALVVLVGSFLPFFELDLFADEGDDGFDDIGQALFAGIIDTSWTAWSNAWTIFPLLTTAVVLAVLVGLVQALQAFSSVKTPSHIGGLGTDVLSMTVAMLGVVTVSAYVLRALLDNGRYANPGMTVGVGGWAVLVGMIILLIGATLAVRSNLVDETVDTEVNISADLRGPEEATSARTATGASTLVQAASAVVTVAASFTPILGASHAWEETLRPIFGLPAIMAVLIVGLMAATAMKHPISFDRVRLSTSTLKIILASYASFASVAILIGNPTFGNMSVDFETTLGQIATVVGSIGLLVGSVMERRTVAELAQREA